MKYKNYWSLRTACLVAGTLTASIALLITPAIQADLTKELVSELDCVVQPSIVADLGVAVPGVIDKIHFDRADYVSKGTLLAELDSELELASLALARHLSEVTTALELRQLNAAFGNRTLNRNQTLYEKASISKQTLDQVRTETEVANLQVKQERENQTLAKLEADRAQAALSRRHVVSPIDGAITERYKSIGEYVSDEPVFQVAQLDPLRIEVAVALEHHDSIETGMTAAVTLDVENYDSDDLRAVVKRIDPVADAASGTYGVWLEMPNPDLTIPSGVRCQIDFIE